MAITAANLGSAHVFANGPYTLSPAASGTGRLQLLALAAGAANGVQPGVPSSVVGRGLTWTLLGSVDYDPAGSTDRATLSLFSAIGTPTAGDITVTYAGKTLVMLEWILDEFDGVDPAPIVQSNTAVGNGLSQSVTLAAFADAVNNAAYGCHAHQAGEATAPGTGFTTLANPLGGDGTGANSSTISEWRLGEDTSVDFSWATSRRCGAVAVEIAAAAAGEVHEGSVALAGAGALSVDGTPEPHGDLPLSGTGLIASTGMPTIVGDLDLDGTGLLDLTGTVGSTDDLALAGDGDLTVTGEPHPVADEPLAGAGTLSLSGTPVFFGTLDLGGSGTLEGDVPALRDTALIVGGLTGPEQIGRLADGPVPRHAAAGPSTRRRVTGTVRAVVAAAGPMLTAAANITGPARSRTVTGPATARTVTGSET